MNTIKHIVNNKAVGVINYIYDLNESFSIGLDKYNSELYIEDVHVEEKYRGKGIAKELLKKVIAKAKDLGVDVITLKRDSGMGCNYGSDYDNYLKHLYSSVGFIETWTKMDSEESHGEKNLCAMHLSIADDKFSRGGNINNFKYQIGSEDIFLINFFF